MSARGAQTSGLLVHHIREFFNAARHVDGDGRSGIVSGGEHQAVQELLHGQLVPGFDPGQGGPCFRDHRILRHRHLIGQIAVLDRDEGRHHLGGAGRIQALKGVLAVDRAAVVQVKDRSRLGGDGIVRIGLFVADDAEIPGKGWGKQFLF